MPKAAKPETKPKTKVRAAGPVVMTSTDLKRLKAAIDVLEQSRKSIKAQVLKKGVIDLGIFIPPVIVDVIIADPRGKGKCTVTPYTLDSVAPGEKVIFHNQTGAKVTITFAGCDGVVSPKRLEIQAGALGAVTIAKDAPTGGFECEYKVSCTGGGGGPTIIIEEP